ncbi:hypothetical protein BN946_scf185013.g153 [Trametes cinnabarina]|uniref:PPM-type phosphatase domain-containing protein n=1 Tax=Pycnoporus cinnabarinus TaxID=5643 RepID=A0A060SM70_PYCCI|nr:hypothetical protein BN946_scf185013.g153 [Trametes cinnabarina]
MITSVSALQVIPSVPGISYDGSPTFRTPEESADFSAYAALSLDPAELALTFKKAHNVDWDPSAIPAALARQVLFVGIYDGHGGSTVSQFLRQELHGLFESVTKHQIPEVYAWTKEVGGYFRRFNGGSLAPWIDPDSPEFQQELDLEARATLAFFEVRGAKSASYCGSSRIEDDSFQVDKILSEEKEAKECGATASVVLLKSLDSRPSGYFQAATVALTVAHVGDTRVLLTPADGGKVVPMTEVHHAESRLESVRLRRMVGALTTDSFGEVRLGDLKFKPFGVTPEPEVRHMLLEGPKWSHITLLSDGVSSVVSDDEISDLARGALSPKHAAERILTFAEDMGGDDNMTAVIVPLAGWGQITGPDQTKELRQYRLRNMQGSERQRGRWM